MLGQRILIVEDEVHVRRMVKDLLNRAGYQVHGATDGLSGLQSLFSERPDLVILDVNMREADGWGSR